MIYNVIMNKATNTTLIIIIVIAVGVAGYFTGASIGKQKGIEQTESNLMPIVDMAFPPPPEIINSAGGTVLGIQGATIKMEMTDPDDYLPHPDGTPKKKITRFANVGSNTEIIRVDYASPNPSTGEPERTVLELSDINENDAVRITTEDNIREEESVDVTKVEVIEI